MSSHEVVVYVEGVDGKYHPQARALRISGEDVDHVRANVRAELAKNADLPPVRTINFTPEGKILVYCASKAQRPPPEKKTKVVYRRPVGPPKI